MATKPSETDDEPDNETTRDLEKELERNGGAVRGLTVDAVCVGCKRVLARRIPGRDSLEEDSTSFRDVCPVCQRVTHFNPIRELSIEEGAE